MATASGESLVSTDLDLRTHNASVKETDMSRQRCFVLFSYSYIYRYIGHDVFNF